MKDKKGSVKILLPAFKKRFNLQVEKENKTLLRETTWTSCSQVLPGTPLEHLDLDLPPEDKNDVQNLIYFQARDKMRPLPNTQLF